MDEWIKGRQIERQRGEGEEDTNLKKQPIGVNNMQWVDIGDVKIIIDTYMAKGEEEEMNDQYWEAIHVVANQALNHILPSNIDVMANVEVDDIVQVEMSCREDILKAFSMFHDRCIICFFTREIIWYVGLLNG